MFDIHAYLRAEFRRYYPDADRIDVHVAEEDYTVAVVTGDHIRHFDFNVGSDEDYFMFTQRGTRFVISAPFPAELGDDA
jgi:hypothetical protein